MNEEFREKCSKRALQLGIIPPKYEKKGKDHWNWQGGKTFEPYGIDFNEKLKDFIRERDNYRCQECGYNEKILGYKLRIHHIDYNKKNNKPQNLVSLCQGCHAQTNFMREDWVKYFQERNSFL